MDANLDKQAQVAATPFPWSEVIGFLLNLGGATIVVWAFLWPLMTKQPMPLLDVPDLMHAIAVILMLFGGGSGLLLQRFEPWLVALIGAVIAMFG